MKKLFVCLAVVTTATAFVACPKQQTEEERKAEVERQVQERLAAERQTQQQQQLDQRQADLDAREKALAEKENATPAAQNEEEQPESESVASHPRTSAPREHAISVGYSTFYNKLEPYGDWIETGDYGYVFHPREATGSRWRPYVNGRWVYTDAGWTWISEEAFGWATYHYGRWTRLRGIGWVWVPGSQWAPAWVSWRKSSDYVGWAPLPPEARFDQRTGIHNWADNYYEIGPDQYCFVASREFGAPRVEQTLLPPERNVTIVNQTTNVTNITYNNTTIVNEGPNYDELRSISREPVQRYRLQRNANVDLATGPRPEVRGETVVIAAPVIAAPAANERPTTVKQTIATAAVDLGWAAIANQDEAKKARQKMKSEAAPPPNAPPKKFVKAEATSAATQTSSTSTTPAPTVAITTPVDTVAAPSAPATTASASPSASQRRGRLLVPPTAMPSPQTKMNGTSQQTPANSPVAADTVPATQITPPPPGSPLVPTSSAPPEKMTRGKFKSQAQQFQPARKVEPMPSDSASTAETAAPSSAVPSPSATAAETLTKSEKREQKREERREMKRERKEGNAPTSPSPTP